jgi:hypothetical protein
MTSCEMSVTQIIPLFHTRRDHDYICTFVKIDAVPYIHFQTHICTHFSPFPIIVLSVIHLQHFLNKTIYSLVIFTKTKCNVTSARTKSVSC